jgi:AcrR family transcriptional regulator
VIEHLSTDETVPVRRAPYCERPDVGAKGLRTQQRILDAALRVFATNGYDRSTLDAVASEAGCSRVSIYQYFSGKDDIFRHLAGQVARQLRGSMDLLDAVTPDAAGVVALRAWVSRYADIHVHFEPVFRMFGTAQASDATLAGGAAIVSERNVATFSARVSGSPWHGRELEVIVALVLGGVSRTLDIAAVLRRSQPRAYTRDRVDDAITRAVHRALFDATSERHTDRGVRRAPGALVMSDELRHLFTRVATLRTEAGQPGRGALARLLEVGDEVVVDHGYRGTRVEHVVSAAGVSRGAFYRYFENIADFVGVIGVRAVDDLSELFREPPARIDRRSLRPWLEQYFAMQAAKGTITRVWMENIADAHGDRAAVYDWGRRQMVRLLERPRGGRARDLDLDIDIDAVTLLAMMESVGASPRAAHEVDAALGIIERAYLAGDAR